MSKHSVVLAFSGGLDTTYCAIWLRTQGYTVHTVTVQTGGFDADALAAIQERATALGAASHTTIDARAELFTNYLRFLVYGNCLRGDVYPLCVSAERVAQAKCTALHALQIGATALAHGSTGAGNDQVRFDVAFRVFAPQLEILTPIRAQALSRADEVAFLEKHGITVPVKTAAYSVNRGLWGTTVGGVETHRSDGELPEAAWTMTAGPDRWPRAAANIAIEFAQGTPTKLDGVSLDPVMLIERLNELAGGYGIGRGVHVGDTILGIKGRVGFEAPAAVTLITAHRELEKLVLSRQQLLWKRTLGDLYGACMHEGRYFDPLMRDLESFLTSSQRTVSGTVNVRLHAGQAIVSGASSPFSLLNPDVALYGEGSKLWNGAEAAAFAKIYGLQDQLLQTVAARQQHAAKGL